MDAMGFGNAVPERAMLWRALDAAACAFFAVGTAVSSIMHDGSANWTVSGALCVLGPGVGHAYRPLGVLMALAGIGLDGTEIYHAATGGGHH
jgi:hypothetical protein